MSWDAYEQALEAASDGPAAGTGHGLFDPDSDPHQPRLHPAVVETLPAWILERTRYPSGSTPTPGQVSAPA